MNYHSYANFKENYVQSFLTCEISMGYMALFL